MAEYIRKLLPISLDKQWKQQTNAKVNSKEYSQMQGLAGSLQWPAAQCFPTLPAFVSLKAVHADSTIQDIVELNRTLRFAKQNGDLSLLFTRAGPLGEMRFGRYADGSWATRRCGSSQIGRGIFVFNEKEWNLGHEVPLILVDLQSEGCSLGCLKPGSGIAGSCNRSRPSGMVRDYGCLDH